jgi:hypothetical protein
VPYVLGGKIFAFKNVAQVCAAVVANYFNTPAISIRHPLHCAGYLVVKTWPATV